MQTKEFITCFEKERPKTPKEKELYELSNSEFSKRQVTVDTGLKIADETNIKQVEEITVRTRSQDYER